MLTLMDWYVGTFPPLFVALFEVLIVAYVYGKLLLILLLVTPKSRFPNHGGSIKM